VISTGAALPRYFFAFSTPIAYTCEKNPLERSHTGLHGGKTLRWTAPLLAVTFVLVSVTHSNSAPRISGYIAGGGGYAIGELAERAEFGFHGRLGIGLTLVPAPSGEIELIAQGGYNRFLSDIDTEGDFTLIPAGIDVKLGYRQQSGLTMYVILGGGYAYTRRESFIMKRTVWEPSGPTVREQEINNRSENCFYISPGVGVEIHRSAFLTPFIELRFTDISGTYIKDYQFFTIAVGLRI